MKRLAFLLLDYCLLVVATLLGYLGSPSFAEPLFADTLPATSVAKTLLVLPLFMAIGLRISNLPFASRTKSRLEQLVQISLGILLGLLCFQLIRAWATAVLPDRTVHLITFGAGFLLIYLSRLARHAINGHYARKVLLCGCSKSYRRFLETQKERGDNRYVFVGYVDLGTTGGEAAERSSGTASEAGVLVAQTPVVGRLALTLETLCSFCQENAVEDVVVEFGDQLDLQLSRTLMDCTAAGINVLETTAFFEEYLECVHESSLDERWFWGFDPAHLHPFYSAFKRSLDVLASMAGLLAFAPLAPLVMLAIKVQDGGPIFYRQVRTGLYNQPFRILKFRTMRVDAERDGAQWASKQDRRVTWLGTFLRRSRIDEVPQFINILRGEMSFVGPRPERPEMITEIEKEVRFFKYRHLIKPGLTGWAQINYPYGASIEDARRKLGYDLYYLKYASPFLDVMIVLRTFVAMARGAR